MADEKRQALLDSLAKLREDISAIDTKYNQKPAYEEFKAAEANAGKVVARIIKHKRGQSKKRNGELPARSKVEDWNKFVKMRQISPRFNRKANCHMVKFFLYKHLQSAGYDFVVNEFRYQRTILDMFALQSNRAVEFEIKLSREDYLNDFSKVVWLGFPHSKHNWIAAGQSIISRFFFVVPENMIDVRECPDHAGMIWFKVVKFSKLYPRTSKRTGERIVKNPYASSDIVLFRVVKPAPLLTTNFVPMGTYKTIAERLYARLQNMHEKYSTALFDKIYKAAINESNIIPGSTTSATQGLATEKAEEEKNTTLGHTATNS